MVGNMQVQPHLSAANFRPRPSANGPSTIPQRDPRLQINGLVNEPDIAVFNKHGRWYYYTTHNQAVYPFPIDKPEFNALTEFQHFIHDTYLKKLHKADLSRCTPGHGPLKVLDVGCGTGDWCYAMAQSHPEMDIHGFDLFINCLENDPADHFNDPKRGQFRAPPNMRNCTLHMSVDFTKAYWHPFQEGSFDFIRAARLCGSVPDWQHLYWCISRYLKPGGFIEHIEMDLEPRTIGGYPFPQEALPLSDWWENMKSASRDDGRPMEYRQEYLKSLLKNLGFTSIKEDTESILLKWHPEGSWEKHAVESFLIILLGDGKGTVTNPLYGLSGSLFTRRLKWSNEAVQQYLARVWDVLQQCLNKNMPIYFNLHILTAKKAMS